MIESSVYRLRTPRMLRTASRITELRWPPPEPSERGGWSAFTLVCPTYGSTEEVGTLRQAAVTAHDNLRKATKRSAPPAVGLSGAGPLPGQLPFHTEDIRINRLKKQPYECNKYNKIF